MTGKQKYSVIACHFVPNTVADSSPSPEKA